MTEPSSAEASRTLEPRAPDAVPRCRRQADGKYTRLYSGVQRLPDPWHEDERGAVAVIELVGDGRLALFTTEDRAWMRRQLLP